MNGLAVLRALFLSFVVALVLVGVFIAVLVNLGNFKGGRLSALPVALVIVIFGIVSLTVTPRLERPLDCSDGARLATSYRSRFFLRIAFAESIALLAFVGFILTGRWWLYPVGGALTAIGFVRLAPSASHLAKDQDRLSRDGCALSVVAALATLPPGRTRST